MCIGNRYGGDDAIGPYIADRLESDENITVINCGIIPENYTSVVKKYKPKILIIIDAVEMNLSPGEIRVISKDRIGIMHISTHGIPISVLMNYLEQYVKNIIFVGIQPETISGKITKTAKQNAEKLVKILQNKNLSSIEKLR
jgi:hydrogenase 3 maturation protease